MAHKVMRIYVLVEDTSDEGRFIFPGKQAWMSWTIGRDPDQEFRREDLPAVMDGLLKAVGIE